MKKIVFATGNPHKLEELKQIAGDCGIEFVLPPEGFDPIENGKTFEENSYIKAFEASRLSGMTALADDSGLCVEALGGAPGIYSARYAETQQKRIDKLLKELDKKSPLPPFTKGGTNDSLVYGKNTDGGNASLVREVDGRSPDGGFPESRKAKFVCAMTLVSPEGEVIFQTTGECHGYITEKHAGTNGFGYDPIFVPMTEIISAKDINTIKANPYPKGKVSEGRKRYKIRTLAEMSNEEKNVHELIELN